MTLGIGVELLMGLGQTQRIYVKTKENFVFFTLGVGEEK